jgi:hypothetical protein
VEARYGSKGTWIKGTITAVHDVSHQKEGTATTTTTTNKNDIAYDDSEVYLIQNLQHHEIWCRTRHTRMVHHSNLTRTRATLAFREALGVLLVLLRLPLGSEEVAVSNQLLQMATSKSPKKY